MWPWRWLYFQPGGATIAEDEPAAWRRGAYLVETLGHCGACHTPRTLFGALDHARAFSGAANPVGEGSIPNITRSQDGLAGWSVDDIAALLEIGMTPAGDFLGGEMAQVVSNSTGRLSASDREAIAIYLLALPPVADAQP
jgi:mono/diheme cytochrome c family protein